MDGDDDIVPSTVSLAISSLSATVSDVSNDTPGIRQLISWWCCVELYTARGGVAWIGAVCDQPRPIIDGPRADRWPQKVIVQKGFAPKIKGTGSPVIEMPSGSQNITLRHWQLSSPPRLDYPLSVKTDNGQAGRTRGWTVRFSSRGSSFLILS